jgi:hypothetical protein
MRKKNGAYDRIILLVDGEISQVYGRDLSSVRLQQASPSAYSQTEHA